MSGWRCSVHGRHATFLAPPALPISIPPFGISLIFKTSSLTKARMTFIRWPSVATLRGWMLLADNLGRARLRVLTMAPSPTFPAIVFGEGAEICTRGRVRSPGFEPRQRWLAAESLHFAQDDAVK